MENNFKDKILNVYPDAFIIEDTHIYGQLEKGVQLPFILMMTGLPNMTILDRKLKMDYFSYYNRNLLKPLSSWCATEDQCWKQAWEKLEIKLINILSGEN
jgi:hypothetical protein